MESEDKTYELISKALTSEISEQENIQLQKEFSVNHTLKKQFQLLEKFWYCYFPFLKHHNTIKKTEKKLDFTYDSNSRFNAGFLYKVAATFFLIFSLGLSAYLLTRAEQNFTVNEYYCGTGEVKEITLSDGTKVWLNNNSFLLAVEPFRGEERKVKLMGEAYFEVEPDAGKPFIVETRNLQTTVLGTKFNIVAYPETEEQEIELYHGKVKLAPQESAEKELHLNPGEKARFSENQNEINVSAIEAAKPAAWRNGLLSFSNEELYNIANTLERKFETPIFIGDQQTGNLRFTAEFEDEPLEKILRLLKEAKAFNYEITGDGIFIRSVK
jgi:ferric-dicitrate binding protein FerR (iron transport regulator)